MFKRLAVAVPSVSLLLAGCGGLPVEPYPGGVDAPPVEESRPSGGGVFPVEPPTQQPANTAAAVDQLLSEAVQLRSLGDIDGAISVAERALRIAPRNTRVYYVLGTLYLDKDEPGEALQLARKASSLDSENFYRRSIDRLIADSEAALAGR